VHETLRKRILRKLETLPEAQLYQVLDYIEFVESRYARHLPTDASGLQTLAERLEDGLRKRSFRPSALREAFQLIDTADRVLGSVRDAGREILAELQAAPELLSGAAGPQHPGPPETDPTTDAERGGGAGEGRPPAPVDTPGGLE
jgi:hypothetical protein